MPMSAPGMGSSISSAGAANTLLGQDWTKIAVAVGSAIVNYLLTTAKVQSIHAGTAGSGTGSGGFINISPTVLKSDLLSSFQMNGIMGQNVVNVATALSDGISVELTKSLAQVIIVGTGPGSGTGSVVAIAAPALTAAISAEFSAKGIVGADAIKLAKAIGDAVVLNIQKLKIQTIDIGPTSVPPVPSAGVGSGSLT